MDRFKKIFNNDYLLKTSAYARVNLIGEHTDYTGGVVLPKLLNRKTEIFISENKEKNVIYSEQFKEKLIITNLNKSKNNHWSDYIKGCLLIIESTFSIPKKYLNILIRSDIPMNRGISSSAALCVSLIKALRNYYNINIDNKQVAIIAQKVEKEYIGLTGGIMDQMVSSIGIIDKAFFLNCYTYEYDLIELPKDYVFCLIDSKSERKLRESSYNKRFNELKKAESYFNNKYLGCVSISELNNKKFINPIIKKRAMHVIMENERVRKAKKALIKKDIKKFGKLMNESHESYSNYFEASNKNVDTIVKRSIKYGALGSRLTGGGFGGFVVSLISKRNYAEWKSNMSKFSNKNNFIED